MLLKLGKNALADDDCIVHDDAQYEYEAKERGEVDTDAKRWKKEHRAEERNRYSQHDEEGKRGAQKKRKDE